MRTKTKALVLSLCAVLLVVTTVFVTMAFLTSQDSVQNTFTVGEVTISLDELDVDNDSNTEDNKTYTVGEENIVRDKANKYHLLPSETYEKDPTVHVATNSEDCFVYVKVTNGIAGAEAQTGIYNGDEYKSISDQIENLGWAKLVVNDKEVDGVYYKTVAKEDANRDLVVFNEFKIKDEITNAELATYVTEEENATKIIEVIAYAVQCAGFDDAADAWSNTFNNL